MGSYVSTLGEGLRQRRAAQIRAEMEVKANPTPAPAPSDAVARREVQETPAEGPGSGPVGAAEYLVRQGECVASIAKDKGHFWETIWNDPANTELREVRGDPNILLPNDRVHIPAKRKKNEPGQTEMRHRFRRRGEPCGFRLRVLQNGEPRGNIPFTLFVGRDTIAGTTAPDGMLEAMIPAAATQGRLVLHADEEELYEIDFGEMDPLESLSGVQRRLNNLGYSPGNLQGTLDEDTKAAVERFRAEHALEAGAGIDEEFKRALEAAHNS